jgi:beta-1,2-mannosidase
VSEGNLELKRTKSTTFSSSPNRLYRAALRILVRDTLSVMLSLCRLGTGIAAFAGAAIAPWMLGTFRRPPDPTPIITPRAETVFQDPILHASVHWEALHTFNPAAIVRNGKVYVLYRAEDNSGQMGIGMHTSRIGLAESDDGIHFTRRDTPVLYPDDDSQRSREWPGGVEDPRIVETVDGIYVLTYTQWNRKIFTVGIATSRDLIHWQKYGPAFGTTGKYASLEYKSAGIVTRFEDGRLIAVKMHGSYWMYWGERPVRLAKSSDLIRWIPVEDTHGVPLILLTNRPGHFDSGFPEVGPPPVLTHSGIVLLYNGKNGDGSDRDTSIGAGAYSVGQALFSAADPNRLLDRSNRPFLKPELPFEKTGQYSAGTTFAEGLVVFHERWFLYYGCADSFVGVAIARRR